MEKKVLVLGAGGMLGHVLFRCLAEKPHYDVYATALNNDDMAPANLSRALAARVRYGVDAENIATVRQAVVSINPDFVVNCVGLVRQAQILANPSAAIAINALFPHKLALMCRDLGARVVHISSDGVFDGKKGGYTERDVVNTSDMYGMTKFLGEVSYPNCVTIRTSIIGHELAGKTGMVEWFLAQNTKVRGYTKAIYSGFPTIELAEIIGAYILPNDKLSGIYHVSSDPISKYDLLKLIAARYGKRIEIEPCDEPVTDRSLDSSLFRSLTGYAAAPWAELVDKMYCGYNEYKKLLKQ